MPLPYFAENHDFLIEDDITTHSLFSPFTWEMPLTQKSKLDIVLVVLLEWGFDKSLPGSLVLASENSVERARSADRQ